MILAQGIDIAHIGWAGAFVTIAAIIGLCFIVWVLFRE